MRVTKKRKETETNGENEVEEGGGGCQLRVPRHPWAAHRQAILSSSKGNL